QQDDIIAIPPGYGHVTIDPTLDQTLTMANLVSTTFTSEYAWYDKMHGAAWYELKGGTMLRNAAYLRVPPLRRMKNIHPIISNLGPGNSLYDFVGNERIVKVLNYPEKYLDFLLSQLRV
ncbi:MAG: glucose-6-phosphate isomerase family protein, partial [Methanoregula sp.]|nr:glucose-6-phosphate isomerase family protein [Methanoregula sp.]